MQYNLNGNITHKPDAGAYTYAQNNAPQHAVTTVSNSNGAITTEHNITYTPFNKVASIANSTDSLAFTYAANQQRIVTRLYQSGSLTQTKYFIGGNYEQEETPTSTRKLHYIMGGDGLCAIHVQETGQANKTYYTHTDYLGSLHRITDANQRVTEEYSFDAWGSGELRIINYELQMKRESEIRNSQFLIRNSKTPDPYVQLPDFTQNYNRYSYVLNNPLMFNDLTGYWWGVDDALVAGVGFIYGYFSYGIQNDEWGLKAVGNGVLSAGMAWIGYNTGGIATAGQGISDATWNFAGSFLTNSIMNDLNMSITLPLSQNTNITINPIVSIGSHSWLGINFGVSVGDPESGSYFAAGLTYRGNMSGWGGTTGKQYDAYFGGGIIIDDYGISYTRTGFSSFNNDGQTVGRIGIHAGKFSAYYENEQGIGDGGDRYRSAAISLNWGKFGIGTNIYTEAPPGGTSKPERLRLAEGMHFFDANGLEAVAYFRYDDYKFGMNSKYIGHSIQNWLTHKNIKAPYLQWGVREGIPLKYHKYFNNMRGHYNPSPFAMRQTGIWYTHW